MLERLTPAPEPPLKMVPSSVYQLRIESIESSTDRMKHAEACWGTPATPMLNQTGELKAAFWWTMRCFSSSLNLGLLVVLEVAVLQAPDVMVSTTRSMTWRSEYSRSGVPSGAPEVLLGQDVGGVELQVSGTSTSSCSKAIEPSR